MVPPFASQPGRSDNNPIGRAPAQPDGKCGSCQRSGIEDLVSDCAVAAGMTAICFYEGSNCGLGHGACLEVRDAALNLFDGAGDDIRAAIQVVAMHRPNEASLQLAFDLAQDFVVPLAGLWP